MPHTEISILMAWSQDSNFYFQFGEGTFIIQEAAFDRKSFFSEHTKFLHKN